MELSKFSIYIVLTLLAFRSFGASQTEYYKCLRAMNDGKDGYVFFGGQLNAVILYHGTAYKVDDNMFRTQHGVAHNHCLQLDRSNPKSLFRINCYYPPSDQQDQCFAVPNPKGPCKRYERANFQVITKKIEGRSNFPLADPIVVSLFKMRAHMEQDTTDPRRQRAQENFKNVERFCAPMMSGSEVSKARAKVFQQIKGAVQTQPQMVKPASEFRR